MSHLLFVGVFFGLLLVPLATHNWHADPGIAATELRQASPLPSSPDSWSSLQAWPKQFDAYLADHFGERTDMVLAFNGIRYGVFGDTPSEQTVFGRHGRLFLTSHGSTKPYDLIGTICGVGVDDAELDRAAAGLESFLQKATPWAAGSYVMVVPTAPALYMQDLPGWLRRRCPPATTMDRLMARLPPGSLRDHLIYPLSALLEAKSRGGVIPVTSFHWVGLGPQAAANAFAGERLGLTPRLVLPTRELTLPSDLRGMIPGIHTANVELFPDNEAAGGQYCWGAACFPDWGPAAGVIDDLSFLRSPQAGDKKLLILSDSFGEAIVRWFAPYFGTVWHFSVSNLNRLSADDRAAFRRHVFTEYKPDVVLYLFHEGAVRYWPMGIAAPALWGP
jgi:hypothetical protein